MTKKAEFVDRRGSIRLKIPVGVAYTTPGNVRVHNATAKDISAEGVRIEAHDKRLNESETVDMRLGITSGKDPVHATGKVIWKRRTSLEDGAPFDIGIEFVEIKEENKNEFIKFLCDFMYKLPEDKRDGENKS